MELFAKKIINNEKNSWQHPVCFHYLDKSKTLMETRSHLSKYIKNLSLKSIYVVSKVKLLVSYINFDTIL